MHWKIRTFLRDIASAVKQELMNDEAEFSEGCGGTPVTASGSVRAVFLLIVCPETKLLSDCYWAVRRCDLSNCVTSISASLINVYGIGGALLKPSKN